MVWEDERTRAFRPEGAHGSQMWSPMHRLTALTAGIPFNCYTISSSWSARKERVGLRVLPACQSSNRSIKPWITQKNSLIALARYNRKSCRASLLNLRKSPTVLLRCSTNCSHGNAPPAFRKRIGLPVAVVDLRLIIASKFCILTSQLQHRTSACSIWVRPL